MTSYMIQICKCCRLTIGSGVHGQQLKVALVDQSLPPIFVHLPSSTIDRRYHLLLIERDAQLGSLATNFSIRVSDNGDW